jgi:hypothetical protein
MRKRALMLVITAATLACGTLATSAQTSGAQSDTQQSPNIQATPGGSTVQQHDQMIRDVQPLEEEDDQDDLFGDYGTMGSGMMGRPGMMGRGMMAPGLMSGGMMRRGWHHDWRGQAMTAPVMMRIIFSLMDGDGDGKLTLQEFQAAHERIFKAMDTDHDGTVSFEEMQAFMHGTNKPARQSP